MYNLVFYKLFSFHMFALYTPRIFAYILKCSMENLEKMHTHTSEPNQNQTNERERKKTLKTASSVCVRVHFDCSNGKNARNPFSVTLELRKKRINLHVHSYLIIAFWTLVRARKPLIK